MLLNVCLFLLKLALSSRKWVKELSKNGEKDSQKEVKTYGRNSVEKASINHAFKKEIRERMEVQMKKMVLNLF